jgi:hypothetical protein
VPARNARFEDVHDYVPGKAGWLAHNLPVEPDTELITAGQVARNDVVTCGLADEVGDVTQRIADSPYGFALVLSGSGVLRSGMDRELTVEGWPGRVTSTRSSPA